MDSLNGFRALYAQYRSKALELELDASAPRGPVMVHVVDMELQRRPRFVPLFDYDYFGFCLMPREHSKV